MTVTLDFEPDSDLYFRGFTGETYHNGVWSAGDDKEFKEQFEDVQTYLWGAELWSSGSGGFLFKKSAKCDTEWRDHSGISWNVTHWRQGVFAVFCKFEDGDSNSSDTVVKLIGDGEIKRAKKSYTTDYYLMSQTEQKSYISSIDDPSLYEDDYDSDDTLEYSSIEQSIEKEIYGVCFETLWVLQCTGVRKI